ncbi:MAG TPA: type II secretion system protein [Bryobacteraceae bacterium]|nr:type II secretion system protein [Bryobacteraceae bacterium]
MMKAAAYAMETCVIRHIELKPAAAACANHALHAQSKSASYVASMRRRGFSLVELLIVMAIILVILAVAIPRAMAAILNAKETAVLREVQTIHQAQIQYSSQFGRFASSLDELQKANIITGKLASGEKDGYLFMLTPTPGGYVLHANPRVFQSTGRRTFYIDQDGVVHQNWGQDPATPESPEL